MAKEKITQAAAYKQFVARYAKGVAASRMEDSLVSTIESNEAAVRNGITSLRAAEARFPQQAAVDLNFQSLLRDLFRMKDELMILKKAGRGLRRKIKITGGALFSNPVDWAFILKSISTQQKILIQMKKSAGKLHQERSEMISRLTGFMRQRKQKKITRRTK
jgi:hypothetical protein